MKAIILAAGRGKRMGNLTQDLPKCLIPFNHKPLLEWQLKAITGAKISEIAIVGGFKFDLLNSYSYMLFENSRWAETNMVRSLMCANSWLQKGDCIISYSDILYPFSTIELLKNQTGNLVVCYNTEWHSLWKMRFKNPLEDAETFKIDRNKYLIDIGKKTNNLRDIEGQYMGLLKITPNGWEIIIKYLHSLPDNKVDKLDMTSLLHQLIARNNIIQTIPVKNKWLEIDSENDVILYNKLLKSNRLSWL